MTGVDEQGQLVLMVESKFWATLTSNQPLVYLRHLSPDKDGMVLFIAPSSRLPTLWQELIRRCTKGGLTVDQRIDQTPKYLVAEVGPRKRLGLVSWESLLSHLKNELEVNGIVDGANEVWQLQGLCERLDAEAFQPLQAEDLKSASDARVEEYRRLVDDLVAMLVEKDYAITKDYRATPGATYYKRYMTLFGNVNWCIEYNGNHWTRFQLTPLWLSISIKTVTRSMEKLNALREESPNRIIKHNKRILFPLELPLNVEKEDILASLVLQIEELEPFIGN